MAIFQFFLLAGKFIEVNFFSRAHQKIFMIFDHILQKNSSKSKYLLLHKIL